LKRRGRTTKDKKKSTTLKKQNPAINNHTLPPHTKQHMVNKTSTYLGDKVQSSLSLLLLQLERNSTDGSTGNSLH
jgi:hypothetical protein